MSNSLLRKYEIIFNAPFHTPKGASIYLTGDIPGVCSWKKVDCLKMEEIYPNSYRVIVQIPDYMKEIRVKFYRGSFESEVSTLTGIPFNDTVINLNKYPNFFVQNGHHWKDLPERLITGNVVKHKRFYSKELNNEREIYVWLPEGYNHSKAKYPVIYMHDGENVFDPRTSTGGVDWDIDGTMTDLLERGEINKAIVVAIFSRNRSEEYSHFLKGRKYARFLVDTIVPFIDREYRTIKNRSSRFLMGSSMGALISFQILWRYSHIFSKAAGLSFPAFIQEKTVFKFLKRYPNRPEYKISFFMDHGDYGIDSKYGPLAVEFYNRVKKIDKEFINIKYRVFKYANHNEADWARRAHLFLKYFLN